MFARFLELIVKPEAKPELIKALKNDILPIVSQCDGFVEMIPLDVEAEPTRFYVMSLWHEKRDAEQYRKDLFPKVQAIYEPFLTAPIVTRFCHVDEKVTTRKFLRAAA
jgi:heme-degrading monooxygenase HmoA